MRKRPQTRDELIRAAEQSNERATRYARALDDVLAGMVVATETSPPDSTGAHYIYRLCRPDAPDGGILLITWHCPGQFDSTSCMNAEDQLSELGRWTNHYDVLDRLRSCHPKWRPSPVAP